MWPPMTVEVILNQMRIHNVSIYINFYQNRFIDECVRKNFLKFPERQMTFCGLQWPLRSYLLKMKYLPIHIISININFYQNRFINEYVRNNFLRFPERQKDRRKDVIVVRCRRTYVRNRMYSTFLVFKL